MASKYDIDMHTARRLGVSQVVVTKYTSCFLEELRTALVHDGVVDIPGLGCLHVSDYIGSNTNIPEAGMAKSRHTRVFFRKSHALRDALKRRIR